MSYDIFVAQPADGADGANAQVATCANFPAVHPRSFSDVAHMSSKSHLFGTASWLLLVIFIYLLGVGPAVRFGAAKEIPSGMRPSNIVGRLWRPILALDDTKARPMYRAYMRLWGVTYYQVVDDRLL